MKLLQVISFIKKKSCSPHHDSLAISVESFEATLTNSFRQLLLSNVQKFV